MSSKTDATTDEDDIPLGKRFRLSDNTKRETKNKIDVTTDDDDTPLGKRFRLSDNAKNANVGMGSMSSSMSTPQRNQTKLDEIAPQPIPAIKLSVIKINAPINKTKPMKRFIPQIHPIMRKVYIKLHKVRLQNESPVVREKIQQQQETFAQQPETEPENSEQQLEGEQQQHSENAIQLMVQEPEQIEEPVQPQIEKEPNIHDDGTFSPLEPFTDDIDDYHNQLFSSIKQGLNSRPDGK